MKSTARFFHILFKLLPVVIKFSIYYRDPSSPQHTQAAIQIRKTFQELGATFIKLGQLLSARADIVGESLANEFRNLLDRQPALEYQTIKDTIENS